MRRKDLYVMRDIQFLPLQTSRLTHFGICQIGEKNLTKNLAEIKRDLLANILQFTLIMVKYALLNTREWQFSQSSYQQNAISNI